MLTHVCVSLPHCIRMSVCLLACLPVCSLINLDPRILRYTRRQTGMIQPQGDPNPLTYLGPLNLKGTSHFLYWPPNLPLMNDLTTGSTHKRWMLLKVQWPCLLVISVSVFWSRKQFLFLCTEIMTMDKQNNTCVRPLKLATISAVLEVYTIY